MLAMPSLFATLLTSANAAGRPCIVPLRGLCMSPYLSVAPVVSFRWQRYRQLAEMGRSDNTADVQAAMLANSSGGAWLAEKKPCALAWVSLAAVPTAGAQELLWLSPAPSLRPPLGRSSPQPGAQGRTAGQVWRGPAGQ